MKQQMPPVAQFNLQGAGQSNQSNQPNIPPTKTSQKMPAVASFSLAGANTNQQPQDFGHKSLDFAKGVGDFFFPIVGDISADIQGKSNKTFLQQTGDAALSVLPFIPGLGEGGEALRGIGAAAEGVKALEGGADIAKSTGLLSKAGDFIKGSTVAKGALTGYGAGVASNLSQGQGVGQSLMPNLNTVGGAVLGGGTAGLLKGLGLGEGTLQKGATEDITKVLNPTTKENKFLTQKIAPRLASEGIVSTSREGLLAKYEANMGKASDALEAAYSKLPQDAKFETTNLFDVLNKKIDDLHINGSVPSAAQNKVNALQNMMRDLSNVGVQVSADGQHVYSDVANIRSLRQILDDQIGKGFAFNDLDNAAKSAQKQLSNSIRSEFAKQYPDIADLNKNFNFWSNASKVLDDTIQRKTGQTGLMRKGFSALVGAGGGIPSGHPIIGAAIMKSLSDFIESPAWHTTSALLKSKLASALESQDSNGITKILKAVSLPAVTSLMGQPFFNQAR